MSKASLAFKRQAAMNLVSEAQRELAESDKGRQAELAKRPGYKAMLADPEWKRLNAKYNRIVAKYRSRRVKWKGKLLEELTDNEKAELHDLTNAEERELQPLRRAIHKLQDDYGLVDPVDSRPPLIVSQSNHVQWDKWDLYPYRDDHPHRIYGVPFYVGTGKPGSVTKCFEGSSPHGRLIGQYWNPTDDERRAIRERYPDAGPQPPWQRIQADLSAAGFHPASWAELTAPTIVVALNVNGPKADGQQQAGAVAKGMTWQEAMPKAVAYVKLCGWPGVNALALEVGCSSATIRKVLREKSEPDARFLAARRAEHDRNRPVRVVPLDGAVLKTTPDRSATDPRQAEIEELAKDQRAELDREERQQARRRFQSKRGPDHKQARD